MNVGDPIWPEPRTIDLPRLLGESVNLVGYPLHMVYAKKILTSLQRGAVNTRWRDFADLYLLTDRNPSTVHNSSTLCRTSRHTVRSS